MVTILRGMPRPFVADVAATASGGEMIAPSTNASAQPKPGINVCAIHATALIEKITQPTASKVIGRFAALKSGHEVAHAAAYRTGGRKTKKTTSGFKTMIGRCGISPIPIPVNTRRIGYGILIA